MLRNSSHDLPRSFSRRWMTINHARLELERTCKDGVSIIARRPSIQDSDRLYSRADSDGIFWDSSKKTSFKTFRFCVSHLRFSEVSKPHHIGLEIICKCRCIWFYAFRSSTDCFKNRNMVRFYDILRDVRAIQLEEPRWDTVRLQDPA